MGDSEDESGANPTGFTSGAAIGDEPTESDQLGFDSYVASLYTFLTHPDTEPPLTVSVEGDWGSGKSSFMLQLKKRLNENGETTIWFNPWRHDKEDDLWAAFVLEFLDQIRGEISFYKQITSGLKLNYNRLSLRQRPKETIRSLSLLISLILITIIVPASIFLLGNNYVIPYLSELFSSQMGVVKILTGSSGLAVTLVALTTLWSRAIQFILHPLELNIEKYMQRSEYRERISFISHFHNDFEQILESYVGNKKVYVFIDDLDRCQIPKSAELIESINLMISQDPRLVFIIGIDRKKLAAGVASKYDEVIPYLSERERPNGEVKNFNENTEAGLNFGYEYLNKFIQVPFKVPQPKPEDIDELVGTIIGQNIDDRDIRELENSLDIEVPSPLPENADSKNGVRSHEMGDEGLEYLNERPDDFQETVLLVSKSLNYNPRKIKRFVNLFRLRVVLANNDGLFEFTNDGGLTKDSLSLQQLGKFVAISLQWPRLLSDLSGNPDLLEELEEYAIDERGDLSYLGTIWATDSTLLDLLVRGSNRENSSKYRLSDIQIGSLLHVSPRTGLASEETGRNGSPLEGLIEGLQQAEVDPETVEALENAELDAPDLDPEMVEALENINLDASDLDPEELEVLNTFRSASVHSESQTEDTDQTTKPDETSVDISDAVGDVVFYNDTGGYGFIESDATDEEVFFHIEDLSVNDSEIKEGIKVKFDVRQAPKGPRATNLRIL